MGKEHCCQMLTRPLVRLLRDESRRVQAALLPMLTATLTHFQPNSESQRESSHGDIVRALLELEAGANRNWRMQVGHVYAHSHTVWLLCAY